LLREHAHICVIRVSFETLEHLARFPSIDKGS
jgi:hypothetical protein